MPNFEEVEATCWIKLQVLHSAIINIVKNEYQGTHICVRELKIHVAAENAGRPNSNQNTCDACFAVCLIWLCQPRVTLISPRCSKLTTRVSSSPSILSINREAGNVGLTSGRRGPLWGPGVPIINLCHMSIFRIIRDWLLIMGRGGHGWATKWENRGSSRQDNTFCIPLQYG